MQFVYKLMKPNKFVMDHQLEVNTSKCTTLDFNNCNYIKNLLGFIGSYNFFAKFNFYKFIQKWHEFCAMVNMNDICTYSIFYIFK
jgi:hypothetical protein